MELTGKIYAIGNVNNVSERFRKRTFVLEYRNANDGPRWLQYAQFELTQADVLEIDNFQIGDDVTVTFEVTGTKYEKLGEEKYYTSLRVLTIGGKDSGVFVPPSTSRRPRKGDKIPATPSPTSLLDDDMGTSAPPPDSIPELPWK